MGVFGDHYLASHSLSLGPWGFGLGEQRTQSEQKHRLQTEGSRRGGRGRERRRGARAQALRVQSPGLHRMHRYLCAFLPPTPAPPATPTPARDCRQLYWAYVSCSQLAPKWSNCLGPGTFPFLCLGVESVQEMLTHSQTPGVKAPFLEPWGAPSLSLPCGALS